jgi:hypothetical protein
VLSFDDQTNLKSKLIFVLSYLSYNIILRIIERSKSFKRIWIQLNKTILNIFFSHLGWILNYQFFNNHFIFSWISSSSLYVAASLYQFLIGIIKLGRFWTEYFHQWEMRIFSRQEGWNLMFVYFSLLVLDSTCMHGDM